MVKGRLWFFYLFLVLNLAATFSSLKFSRDDFPPDFIFGSGTSAYQVCLLFLLLFFFLKRLFTFSYCLWNHLLNKELQLFMSFGLLHKRLKEQRFKMGGPQVSGIPLFMVVSFYFYYNNYYSFIRNIWLKDIK